jgi:hypothetical protein
MLYLCVFICICTRHIMRGSMKILYPVMWQLLRLFLFEFVNWKSGNHNAIKLQSRTCLFLQLCFFAIAAHQRFATTLSRMFAITCIFTKLQPHQAKTKLVTSSFLPVFCNHNHTAIRGAITLRHVLQSQHISRCKHTAKYVAINSILTRLQPINQRPP